MTIYLFKRILGAVPSLLFLLALTFFLLRLAPGGPFDTDRAWPPEVQKNIEKRYGLDQSLPAQFVNWLSDLARGDLRESFHYTGTPVSEILSESIPPSLALGAWSLAIATVVGLILGAAAAWKERSWLDWSATWIAIAGLNLPSYLVASALILVFAIHLGWLPPALWEGPESLILPVITLSLRPASMIARLTRTTLIESLRSDYIRTARAKGLSEAKVLFKHALRNSLIPVLTLLGPLAANLITGSFIVEVIFQIPGMGKHFVSAVLNRDYPLVMGVTLFYGAVLIASNLLVDLAYGWIDPRIRIARDA